MPMTIKKKSDKISEETSESITELPENEYVIIFQGEGLSQTNAMTELNTLLADEEEGNELQEYWQRNPDYDTRPKTIIRQFEITISKSKIETVEIPGIQDVKLPGIEDLVSRGFSKDLQSYWQESQDLNVNPKPSYK